MLKIYTLKNCSYCNHLVKLLNSENIAYIAIDAEEEEEQAIKLEDLLNTYVYPICIIEKEGYTVYLISSDTTTVTSTGNIATVGYLSIQHLVTLIKKFI